MENIVITLRDYQQDAVDSIYRYFESNSGNCLLVLPTGAGKSIIISEFIRSALSRYPETRILMATHQKELIEQDYSKLKMLWPAAPVGIHSASIGRRDLFEPIIFAGIQSIYKKAMHIGRIDICVIDEAHLINHQQDGMYRQFLTEAVKINPALKVIGLTATAFRTSHGDITHGEQRIFTDVAYELPLRRLVDAGHLAPLVSKQPATQMDVAGVKIRQGEFVTADLARAVDTDDITRAAVNEILSLGAERRSWLVFAVNVAHAHHVADELGKQVTVGVVTGKTPKRERERLLHDFKTHRIKAIVNVGVLTTGFDAPATDLIAFLRPTCSPGLYVQMAGRGMRTAPGKENCLVLDFAGNIARHGPVDTVRAWRPKKREKREAAPTKVCPECDEILATAVRICPVCDYEFPFEPVKHAASASTLAVLSNNESKVERIEITDVAYRPHNKPGKPVSMRVDYYAGLHRVVSEWVCLEHTGYPKTKAVAWWMGRTKTPVPESVVDGIALSVSLRRPSAIHVDTAKRYPEIVSYEWPDQQTPTEIHAGDDAVVRGNDGSPGLPFVRPLA